jgi:Alcohol dehydrogenase GroES-like domain
MRAMVLHQAGMPLKDEVVADPLPGFGQVLVKVAACGVCRTDLHVVDGDLSEPKLPIIPGHEIVGRALAIGSASPGSGTPAVTATIAGAAPKSVRCAEVYRLPRSTVVMPSTRWPRPPTALLCRCRHYFCAGGRLAAGRAGLGAQGRDRRARRYPHEHHSRHALRSVMGRARGEIRRQFDPAGCARVSQACRAHPHRNRGRTLCARRRQYCPRPPAQW